MKPISFAATDVGRIRQHNEDAYVADDVRGLYVVADGMGGHEAGEVAAKIACDTIAMGHGSLVRAVEAAHEAIVAEQLNRGQRKHKMGATIVAMRFDGPVADIVWAGDSRAYLFRDGILRHLTKDHAPTEAMVAAGLMPAHTVWSALGCSDLTLEIAQVEWQIGDVFLLCSDGLHGQVNDASVADVLGKYAAHALLNVPHEFVKIANDAGGVDNVTAVLVKCCEGSAP